MHKTHRPIDYAYLEDLFANDKKFICSRGTKRVTVKGIEGKLEGYTYLQPVGIPRCKYYNATNGDCTIPKDGKPTYCYHARQSTTYYKEDREGDLYAC